MNSVRKIALAIAILGSVVMVTKPATQADVDACQKLVNDFQVWEKQLLDNLYGIQWTWRLNTGYTLTEPGLVMKDRNLLAQYFTASNAFRDWYGQQYMIAQGRYNTNLNPYLQAGVVVKDNVCMLPASAPEAAEVKAAAAAPKKSGRRYNRGGQRKLQRRKTQRGIRKVPTITGQ